MRGTVPRHTAIVPKSTSGKPGFETLAIHAGQDPEGMTGSVQVPIFQTSTYVQEAVGKNKGYDYARTGNPTRTALEACLAALEDGKWGLAFGSGMSATDVIAGGQQVRDRIGRGHARRECERPRAVLERGETGLERGARRIAGARVLVALVLADGFLRECRGLEDRNGHGSGGRIRLLPRVDRERVEARLTRRGDLGHRAGG